ncbi:DUF6343 family protein [Streptomyces sp. RB6PN25]|uniref:DUF6343 family protein n=1 Tax=Streptomyces humicola TaxID=2953240 RepID=A0ABT1PXK7_9ACTN|nr:DUF6343 family protein [Streptomyces humicola]MCQ4082397.1 DUF6343 family protein [Streptomyces humicola]
MRTGSEPTQARSPLRLRLGLTAWGLLWAVGGMIIFLFAGLPGWAAAFGAVALVALVDMGVVIRHIHQGAHYQPGRDIPPYWPVDRGRRR